MKQLSRILLVTLSAYAYFGCSKVVFQAEPNASCSSFNTAYGSNACVYTPDGLAEYNFKVKTGEVDILFVIDNSASMYKEQQNIANQFPQFLDSIKNFDYQIAMITTDVPASVGNKRGPQNGDGDFWDGKFLKFSNGATVLKSKSYNPTLHAQNVQLFRQTIQRDETLVCDPKQNNCPSNDERGIFALNRALDRSENGSFFRKGGHLAVVILSDEDERAVAPGAATSVINRALNPGLYDLESYKLHVYDLPETFVQKFAQQADSTKTKTLSVHSIIIKPKVVKHSNGTVSFTTGDYQGDSCLAQQDAQGNGVRGFYGTQYAALSAPSAAMKAMGNIVDGKIGDICSGNYTQQMEPIADKIKGLDFVQLPCAPVLSTVSIDLTPAPAGQISFDVDPSNSSRLTFSPVIPPGTNVDLTFKCPR